MMAASVAGQPYFLSNANPNSICPPVQTDAYLNTSCSIQYTSEDFPCNIIISCADCLGGSRLLPWNVSVFDDPSSSSSVGVTKVQCPQSSLDDDGIALLKLNFVLTETCPPDNSTVNTLNVVCAGPGASLPEFPDLPDAATDTSASSCGARLAATFTLADQTAQSAFVLSLLSKKITMPGYIVLSPSSNDNMAVSSTLQTTVRNTNTLAITVTDQAVAKSIAATLGLRQEQVFIVSGPDGSLNGTSGSGNLALFAPPPPPPPKKCDRPHLGSLCGAEALGVIVAIIIGSVLLLAAFILLAVCLISRGRQPVMAEDDYAWAQKYAHVTPGIMPAYAPPVFRAQPYSVDLNQQSVYVGSTVVRE
ncbi:hypothetical protein GPECTOR_2g1095 [Gonium pectorale]|uniref:Uncharacterized protein n=1 Tax=Gonium pectorale TaxID=33097 RepID=A0A150H053_GONPE|nr:hypothetical protein GPECTOR_2g1095 [Gonium pectorale]|eukprot:KXZ55546.1 hypothetical protein GPECTOR_2g1095 [Gonium pectorale]